MNDSTQFTTRTAFTSRTTHTGNGSETVEVEENVNARGQLRITALDVTNEKTDRYVHMTEKRLIELVNSFNDVKEVKTQ